MISLKQWLELVKYKVTDASEFMWECYGSNAQSFDSWNGLNGEGGYSVGIVFDRKDQTVYEVEVYDYTNNRAYKYINPEYTEAEKEENARKCFPDEDDIKIIRLDVEADFLEKAEAIIQGQEYDTRVQMEVNFSQEELTKYMLMAHEQDITLNQFIENSLRWVSENKENLR